MLLLYTQVMSRLTKKLLCMNNHSPLFLQNDVSQVCPFPWQLNGWIDLLMRENGINIDIVQVATISDAVKVMFAVAERDSELSNPDSCISSMQNSMAEQDIIDVLSHVPQLRNPHTLANCASLLAKSDDDGLG